MCGHVESTQLLTRRHDCGVQSVLSGVHLRGQHLRARGDASECHKSPTSVALHTDGKVQDSVRTTAFARQRSCPLAAICFFYRKRLNCGFPLLLVHASCCCLPCLCHWPSPGLSSRTSAQQLLAALVIVYSVWIFWLAGSALCRSAAEIKGIHRRQLMLVASSFTLVLLLPSVVLGTLSPRASGS